MRTLHLDKYFNPCGYDIKYEKFCFPAGETHLKLNIDFEDSVLITQVIRNSGDIMEILLAVDALRRENIKDISLFIPYAPYARQDRIMVKGEPLSIKIFANIINSLGLNKVYIFDPHSDVTPALINNCCVINNHHFIEYVCKAIFKESQNFLEKEKLYLICPDAGANKKIKDLAMHLSELGLYDIQIVQCDKTRNVATGAITGFKVYSDNLDFSDAPCLIVDDICDGGGTFIGLANQLLNFNPPALYLAISHGIFSNGIKCLTNHCFDKVFTTNSFYKNQFPEIIPYQIQIEV